MKTRVMVGITIVVLASVGVGGYHLYQKDIQERIKASSSAREDLKIELIDDELEYGRVPIDATKVVKADNGSRKDDYLELSAFPKEIDVSEVGETVISYTLSDMDAYGNEVQIVQDYTIKVVDTKTPKIKLSKSSFDVTVDDDFDLKSIVDSVKDPVDGELKYSDGEVTEMTYGIDAKRFDIHKAGNYEVSVLAMDRNGNTSKAVAIIHVLEKETKE